MLVSTDAEAARAGTDGYTDTQYRHTHKTSTVTLAHARRGLIVCNDVTLLSIFTRGLTNCA